MTDLGQIIFNKDFLYYFRIVEEDTHEDEAMEDITISPPDPSLIDELSVTDYNVPSDIEEDSIVDEIPSVSDNSESDSETEWVSTFVSHLSETFIPKLATHKSSLF